MEPRVDKSSRTLRFDIRTSLYERLEAVAVDHDMGAQQYVRSIIEEHLTAHETRRADLKATR